MDQYRTHDRAFFSPTPHICAIVRLTRRAFTVSNCAIPPASPREPSISLYAVLVFRVYFSESPCAMTRKYSKNLMARWWVKGGQAWFSKKPQGWRYSSDSFRRWVQSPREAGGRRVFPGHCRGGTCALVFVPLDDCFAHGGEDIHSMNRTSRIRSQEVATSPHPRDELEVMLWVYGNGRMPQTGLTPRASGSAPSAILDFTRMGNQSVVAHEPFDLAAIWPIRGDVA